jgi:hypothetical protein
VDFYVFVHRSDMLNQAEPKLSFEYDIAFMALTPNEAVGHVVGFEN